MMAEKEIATIMPESIDDTNNVFLRCAKIHPYEPDSHIRKIPYTILAHEFKRLHKLIEEYFVEEVDYCYQLPTELLVQLKYRQDKELKESTFRNYRTIIKYDIIHAFRYKKYITCSERGCPCRLLIPASGFYAEGSNDPNTQVHRSKIGDPISTSMKHQLLPLECEETDIFQLSHDLMKHQKESKCPLNTSNIPFSNGNSYDITICNQTEKYHNHIKYCDKILIA